MAESAATQNLGKRARDGSEEPAVEVTVPDMPAADVDDSSDEEIGPMPTAPGEEASVVVTNGRKKKRAGMWKPPRRWRCD